MKKNEKEFPNLICFAFDVISLEIMTNGLYEKNILYFLSKEIFPKMPRRDVCIDVGANIGNHSLFFSGFFEKVVAIEPHPRTFEVLRLNASLANNIITLNYAASDRTGSAWATAKYAINTGSTYVAENTYIEKSVEKNFERSSEKGMVKFYLKPIDEDEKMKKIDNVDFVKIDVEGHEFEVLRGAINLLSKHKPVIMMEVLSSQIRDGRSKAIDLLKDIGYTHFYEISSRAGRLKVTKIMKIFIEDLPGMKQLRLCSLELLEERNYPAIIASPFPLKDP